MFFRQDLYSLATQPAPGKGGQNCVDGAKRKEMKRKRGKHKGRSWVTVREGEEKWLVFS